MAKSDAEVTLKVNMPPPNEFKKALGEFERLAKGAKDSLAQMGTQVKDVAEGVRIMGERARSTGSGAVVKSVEGSFVEGYKSASTMDVKAGKVETGLANLEARVAKVKAALEAGEISEAEAAKLMQKYVAEVKKASDATDDLVYTLEATKGDMAAAVELDEMLAKFEKFRLEAGGVADGARGLAAELRAQADAFAEQREALDASMPGYEQAAAELLKLENEYRGLEKAASRVADGAEASVGKVQESLKAWDGSAEQQKKTFAVIAEQQKKMAEADGKLEEVANKRAINEQTRAANAEKNAQKEADAKAKAEAKAEEQAKREQERAEQREVREAQMAARDEERAERERFNMKLSLLSKDELIKKLQELQAAREAAAKAGDSKTYEKRTREFMQAREQMEKVNTQLNLTRMAWTQQAQMANQFAGSLTSVATGLGSIGDAAEKGELDLVGLAGGIQQVGTSFAMMLQAGLGPIGILTLALQGLQLMWNKLAKAEQERARAAKQHEEWQKRLIKVQEDNRDALAAYNAEVANDRSLKEMVDKHRELNDELDKEIAHIEEVTQLELHRLRLSQDAAAHELAMKKDELGRKLMRGEITQEEYEEQLAVWQRDAELRKLQDDVTAASARAEGAGEKEKLEREAYGKRTEDFDYWKKESRKFGWDTERFALFEQQRLGAEALLAEKTQVVQKLREEGASENQLNDAKNEMRDALREKLRIEREAKEMLLGTYGAGHGMEFEEALKRYKAELHEMTTHLQAATEAKAEAAADLAEAEAEAREAGKALEEAELAQRLEGERVEDRYESGKETRATRKAEKDKAEKRERRLEDLRNKADNMTEDELRERLAAARAARKNAKDEHERGFAKAQVELYRGRLKGRRETERERLAAATLENDLQGSAVARRAFGQMDLQGALNTMDDGRLSKGELRLLVRQMELARKAENAEAQAMIREIVAAALASKKMSAEYKRQIKTAFEK